MKLFILTSCLFIVSLIPITGSAQPASSRDDYLNDIGAPIFHLDAITLLAEDPGVTSLVVYIEIVYDNLQFLRSPRGFEASYEVDVSVLVGSEESAPRFANKITRETVVSHNYNETNARDRYAVSVIFFDVPPGTYKLLATLTDLESKLKSDAEKTLVVPSYKLSGLHLGDILLSKKVKLSEDNNFEITPNVNHLVQFSERPVYLYYEVYPEDADTLGVYSRILNQQGEVVREKRFLLLSVKPITRDFVVFDVNKLPYGKYVIEHQVSYDGKKVLKGTFFTIQAAGIPSAVQDLAEAVRQLRYITPRREIKVILESNPMKMEQMFKDFWKKRDPTSETQVNELMEEYYGRIVTTNMLFGTFREGWETDRGEVYVRFGPPSEIERHPFEVNSKPYEIWYYYEIKQQFIFVDDMGYGEYRRANSLWQ
ncbi:MAG: GWxTD domain-containing protein [Candidatus Electryonea clarkiae]|nr:GWxTD domain-containing protein [Candidatus Electryonea clarkiae]MDP8287627.1 GWxTD domain-containing protein [Candidatus Electryonea clarkiae]